MSTRPASVKPVSPPLETVRPIGRKRLAWRDELLLVTLPTVTVLIVFAIVERYAHQRLLFASLVSSAFLIYLDPEHPTNKVRTLVVSQLGAAIVGAAAIWLLGPGYLAATSAMVVTIVGMMVLDVVHPPAVSTALAFSFKGDDDSSLIVFVAAVGVVALLVAIEQASLWVLARSRRLRA